jgi:hypothetical protein
MLSCNWYVPGVPMDRPSRQLNVWPGLRDEPLQLVWKPMLDPALLKIATPRNP